MARQLGIGVDSLRLWVCQAEVDGGQRPGTTTADATRIVSSSRRSRSCAGPMRSCARQRFSSRGSSTPDTEAIVAYIDIHRDRFGVEPILHALEVAPSTYYCSKARPPSKRSLSGAALKRRILQLWKDNYSVYGVRKLTKALRREGVVVGRDQVGRLMATLGIAGMVHGKSKRTTKADPCAVRAPDLVRRLFAASEPNRLWVSDFTYVPPWAGTVYVAFIVDAFSRAIVGWKAATSMATDLVLDALEMAIWRQASVLSGLAPIPTPAASTPPSATPTPGRDRGPLLRSARSGTHMTTPWPRP